MRRQPLGRQRGKFIREPLAARAVLRHDERECLDETAGVGGAHDGRLGHPRMRQQHVFNVGRRHPLAGDLEHVVGASAVVVEAVGVPYEYVAGAEPAVHERATCRLRPVPVARTRRRCAHVQDARHAVGHGPAVGVEQPRVCPRHDRPRRARATRAGPVREHHENRLGGAEPVEDLDAEARPPRVVDFRRQALAGRDAGADRAERVGRQFRAQHARIEGRHGEEQRRPERGDGAGDDIGLGPARVEKGLRAGVERNEQRVAERIREEELGRRQYAIALGRAEDVDAIVAAREQVAMSVDGGFGAARRARRIEPECHRLVVHRLSRQRVGRPRLQRFESGVAAVARDDDALELRPLAERCREIAEQCRVAHEHARAAVGQHRRPVGGAEPRVERNGDGADAQRAEECGGPRDAIGQQQRDALAALDTRAAQHVARPAHETEQLRVGGRGLEPDDGRTGAAPVRDVVVEERECRVRHGRVAVHDTIGGRGRTARARATCQATNSAMPSTTQTPPARQAPGELSRNASRPSSVARPT